MSGFGVVACWHGMVVHMPKKKSRFNTTYENIRPKDLTWPTFFLLFDYRVPPRVLNEALSNNAECTWHDFNPDSPVAELFRWLLVQCQSFSNVSLWAVMGVPIFLISAGTCHWWAPLWQKAETVTMKCEKKSNWTAVMGSRSLNPVLECQSKEREQNVIK